MQPRKKTSPVFWIALIGIGIAAYVLTTPHAIQSARRNPGDG